MLYFGSTTTTTTASTITLRTVSPTTIITTIISNTSQKLVKFKGLSASGKFHIFSHFHSLWLLWCQDIFTFKETQASNAPPTQLFFQLY